MQNLFLQFIERLDFESIGKRTRDLLETINQSVSGSAYTMLDLTRNKSKIDDPERSEVYGQNDLC